MELKNLIVYDNEGKTFDRYTVLTSQHGKYWDSLSLSHNPDHPQGFSQWGLALRGDHLGKRIRFSDLPENVQAHVARRLA